jgi:hypothetical protein
MMGKRSYYCLIAGRPVVVVGDGGPRAALILALAQVTDKDFEHRVTIGQRITASVRDITDAQ